MFERRDEPTLFDLIFDLAGGSGSPAGRLRLWSAIVLVLMGTLAVISGFFVLTTSSTATLSAARIESGFNPRLTYRGRRGQTYRERYQISGRLSELDTAVFTHQEVAWRCTPVVSDADSRPRVYYVATETSYRRARAENRFAGEIYRASDPYAVNGDTAACQAPPDAYLLVDDGSFRAWRETARSLLTMAAVIGSIALIAFLAALRAQRDRPATPTPLPD